MPRRASAGACRRDERVQGAEGITRHERTPADVMSESIGIPPHL
jgi:hypothetical protein